MAVIVFHFFPQFIPSGFLGVDIFFVISGYLITQIIYSDLQNNSFSLVIFYTRRINRIFPALLCTLILAGIAALFRLEGTFLKNFFRYALAAATFVSNFFLYSESGYFDLQSYLKPLLHLWSLAIEEQFYLILPVLFLGIWKFNRKLFSPAIIALTFYSFAFCLYKTKVDYNFAFYSPFTRAWEFLVGSLLAVYFRQNSQLNVSKFGQFNSLLSFAILIYIFASSIPLDEFPGLYAVIPILASAGIILSQRSFVNRFIFANKFMVHLGLISYPLYLVHWPILFFIRDSKNFQGLDVSTSLFGIGISYLLAVFIKFGVEDYFLKTKTSKPKAIFLMVTMFLIAVVSGFNFHRLQRQEDLTLSGPIGDQQYKIFRKCLRDLDEEADLTLPGFCIASTKTDILLWGDSSAQTLSLPLQVFAQSQGLVFSQITHSGCKPVFSKTHFKNVCRDYSETIKNLIIKIQPKIIVYYLWWTSKNASSNHTIASEIKEAMQVISSSLPTTKIIFIGPSPQWEISPEYHFLKSHPDFDLKAPHPDSDYYSNEGLLNKFNSENGQLTYSGLDLLLKETFTEFKNLKYISIYDQFCNASGCLSRVGTQWFSFDSGHLNRNTADLVVKRIEPDLKVP